jgi:hypothetical protein
MAWARCLPHEHYRPDFAGAAHDANGFMPVPSAVGVGGGRVQLRMTRLIRLTTPLISCARPRAPRSDAARPLPRLTNAFGRSDLQRT